MKTYTYYAVVRDGITIYEGMGRAEAKAYAKRHGGIVMPRKAASARAAIARAKGEDR